MSKRCTGMNLKELLDFMLVNEMSLKFPMRCCSLVEYAITIPLHTADCERSFRALNLIKKAGIRNRINSCHIINILMIKIEGPERKTFNFGQVWEMGQIKRKKSFDSKPKCLKKINHFKNSHLFLIFFKLLKKCSYH